MPHSAMLNPNTERTASRWRSAQVGSAVWLANCVVLGLLLVLCDATAQTQPQLTQWSAATTRINPAASAQLFSIDAAAGVRRQWLGLQGSPTTTLLTVGAPVYIIGGGASLGIEVDASGLTDFTQIKGGVSYRIELGRSSGALSFGLGGSFRQGRIDGNRLRTPDGEYAPGLVSHLDPNLPITTVQATTMGFDLGLEYVLGDLRAGIAVLDVNEPTVDWEGQPYQIARTALVYGQYLLPAAERLEVELSALFMTDTRLAQSQLGAFAWYDGNIGFGTSLRGYSGASLDAVALQLGYRASEALSFGYAYDVGVSALRSVHEGSHELIVRYQMQTPIGKGRLPPVIFNPR